MAANSSLSSPMDPLAREKDAKGIQLIEDMTRNADIVQKNFLSEILTRNSDTEYLKKFNLNGATDQETFKSKIPIITYDDIEPFVRRIADGDRSPILSSLPISEFIFSSGTSSGEPKLIPSGREESNRRHLLFSLMTSIIKLHVNGVDKGKGLHFWFTKADIKTKGGIPARSATTSLFKGDLFKTRPYPHNMCTSPNEAVYCLDTYQSTYAQLLCGLYEREHIMRVGAIFASGLLSVIKFLKLNWEQLAHDIRTGSLNLKITDPPLRECMTRIVRPDPELADLIARECANGDNWEGIITRIWPNTKLLEMIVTGTMAQYIPTLDHYSGGLPKVSMLYGASECFFGLNLDPMCDPSEVSYTIMPNMAYFEFSPLESEPDSPGQLVDLVDVEIGKEYEVVITNSSGLYRYRMGDVLKVTGFHHKSPKLQFVRRKNMLLNIDWEKTNEVDLQEAVGHAAKLLREFGTSVVDYTSYADTSTIPGHYVIYWELQAPLKEDSCEKVIEQCCIAMEESLNPIYRLLRVDGSIGPLEIRVVKSGTFEELMNYAISKGGSIGQYKVPRCVSFKPIVDILDSRVLATSFSTSLPKSTRE
ncbi:hypothetical protein MIMGU_mgv1a003400mg [Erythranthe guttata]|uniref:Uncharacterized protein n=1 Tax=Erythranthe guttata TaxID=4155 RepID=A0A022RTA9_ERYGU|nr:PREDICTED: probable indole-3-acetic acid-amido synthetase GH3.1 [Erythranthe guttata]EYU42175.1 hypothetical protein MIMGU_mgv1a003400mg [Erythranthe guttata]|eukprot:XP_012831582.1 PREDICTED: probable indole-3-acetic acid-amido synthetase GH3.1 [Erythranthe guttata]